MKKDIESRADVIHFVNSFYDKVRADALLAPTFAHVDWPKHLPTMYNFWSSILLGDGSYFGSPMQKHLPLKKIDSQHFHRWLELFKSTIDESFEGEKAQETKVRAESISSLFQFKMGLMKKNE